MAYIENARRPALDETANELKGGNRKKKKDAIGTREHE